MDKIYEASKGSENKKEVTEREVINLGLSGGFLSNFKRLKIGEEMFNYELMTNFKRIKQHSLSSG